MAAGTRTRYAKSGDVDIAYQVRGDGPIDVLLYTGAIIPIECMDEEPSMARFQHRLASFSRLLRFDRRGIGLSDRGSASAPPTMAQWADDGVAVMDAVGSEQAVVLAPFETAHAGLMLAIAHPDRVTGLVIVNSGARAAWAPDYPCGIPETEIDTAVALGAETDAVEKGHDVLSLFAPSVAEDNAFRAWWDRAGNLGATPSMATAINAMEWESDVRHLLPLVKVPTLITHCDSNPLFDGSAGRYLAEHIPRAKFVELPGSDMLYWVGDTGPLLDEIEEFATGVRSESGSERVLSTVLFTDIVGSTGRAAQLGDVRWRDLLDRHDQSVRSQITRFRGREVKTVGDGFMVTFDSPRRAIECALAIRETLAAFGIGVRAGIHTGEIELRGDDIAGMAVHIGARVSAVGGPGDVLVSSTVKDLVVGSTIKFSDRGEHEFKGVPGTWRLYAAQA